jgi:hypothetical protein
VGISEKETRMINRDSVRAKKVIEYSKICVGRDVRFDGIESLDCDQIGDGRGGMWNSFDSCGSRSSGQVK